MWILKSESCLQRYSQIRAGSVTAPQGLLLPHIRSAVPSPQKEEEGERAGDLSLLGFCPLPRSPASLLSNWWAEIDPSFPYHDSAQMPFYFQSHQAVWCEGGSALQAHMLGSVTYQPGDVRHMASGTLTFSPWLPGGECNALCNALGDVGSGEIAPLACC